MKRDSCSETPGLDRNNACLSLRFSGTFLSFWQISEVPVHSSTFVASSAKNINFLFYKHSCPLNSVWKDQPLSLLICLGIEDS